MPATNLTPCTTDSGRAAGEGVGGKAGRGGGKAGRGVVGWAADGKREARKGCWEKGLNGSVEVGREGGRVGVRRGRGAGGPGEGDGSHYSKHFPISLEKFLSSRCKQSALGCEIVKNCV